MNHAEQLREATQRPEPGARERVWQRLQTKPVAPNPFAPWAFAVAGVAIVLAVLVFRPGPPVRLNGEGFVALAHGHTTQQGNTLNVESGDVLVSSFGSPMVVTAGAHRIETDSAVFAVQVAADRFTVAVSEGSVRIDGERAVAAPSAFRPDFAALRVLEPAHASTDRAWALAEGAAQEGRIDEAIERFAALAQSSPLRAEAALLRKAQLELWHQHRPDVSLLTLAGVARRFPNGALQQEVAVSELEALVAQAQWEAVSARAAAFGERFPSSERRDEVLLVAAVAAAQRADLPGACALAAKLDAARLPAEQMQTAAALTAQCNSK